MARLILILSVLSIYGKQSMGHPLYLSPFSFDSFPPPPSSFYTESSIESPQFPNFIPQFSSPFSRTPFFQQTFPTTYHRPPQPDFYNFFPEPPYSIANRLAVVPLIVVPQTQINMVTEGKIKGMPTKTRPILTVQTNKNLNLQCTPAVRVVLQQPIVVTTIRSQVLFPAEMSVIYNQLRVPIKVGAVIAPILPDLEVSPDSPLSIGVVYAIPALPEEDGETTEISIEKDVELNKPLNPKPSNESNVESTTTEGKPTSPATADYVNNDKDVTVDKETQAVIVESAEDDDAPSDSTSTSASATDLTLPTVGKPEPVIAEIDEEADQELVNRNPPTEFHNSKESDVLNELREQSKKERLRT